MARTVQTTIANWKLPTGQFMGHDAAVIAGTGSGWGYDAPNTWAQGILNAYEHLKPPLINDRWKDLGGAGSGSQATMAEYVLPSDWIGNGFSGAGTIEGLVVDLRGRVAGGDSATFNLVTPDQTDSVVYASGTEGWFTGSTKVELIAHSGGHSGYRIAPGPQNDFLFQIRCSATTGSNVHLYAAHVRFWRESSTLPGEVYEGGFVPPDLADHDTSGNPLTVAQMRRMLLALDELKRRRCTGMIMASYLPGAVGAKAFGGSTNCAFRTRTFQPEHVTTARVYLLGRGGSGTESQRKVAVYLGDTVRYIVLNPSTTDTWVSCDIPVTAHNLEHDVTSELRVVVPSDMVATGSVRACCAWWRPIVGNM